MKIIKIVVDKLPKTCEYCDIFDDLTYECSILDMYVGNMNKRRHEKCPLIEKDDPELLCKISKIGGLNEKTQAGR